jgi:hypothetical protein
VPVAPQFATEAQYCALLDVHPACAVQFGMVDRSTRDVVCARVAAIGGASARGS